MAMKTTVTHMAKQAHTRTAMHDVRITAVQQTTYPQLMARYENPIQHACSIRPGQQWTSVGGKRPEGLCTEAWASMSKFVQALAHGKGNFFDGWMKNPMSAMISCNDGFRPVSFYIEVIKPAHPTPQDCDSTEQPKAVDRRMEKLVVAVGKKALTRKQIMANLGLKEKSRQAFIDNYFKPAYEQMLIDFAYPGTPSKPPQAYILTPMGLDLLSRLAKR